MWARSHCGGAGARTAMIRQTLKPVTSVVLFALLLVAPGGVQGQDSPPPGWSNTAELSYVLTAGNASSSSLGLRNTTLYRWPEASLLFGLGGIRTESETTTRTATGTVDDFTITEETETTLTAENYFARSRYDRTVSDALFVFGGAGWERNTFAGVQNRTVLSAGGGQAWFDREDFRLKTDLGLTYTFQDDLVEDPETPDSFGGLRASVDFFRQLTESTELASLLTVDENLEELSDLRADWATSLAVAISSNLALKTSYQLFFDNEPSLVAVPLGTEQVFTPLEKVDSIVTVAVVVEF